MERNGGLAFKLICPPSSWITARSVVAGTSQGYLCRGAALVIVYYQLSITSCRILWLWVSSSVPRTIRCEAGGGGVECSICGTSALCDTTSNASDGICKK